MLQRSPAVKSKVLELDGFNLMALAKQAAFGLKKAITQKRNDKARRS